MANLPGGGGLGHPGQRAGPCWPLRVSPGASAPAEPRIPPGWSLPGVGTKGPPRGGLSGVKSPNVAVAVLSPGGGGWGGAQGMPALSMTRFELLPILPLSSTI